MRSHILLVIGLLVLQLTACTRAPKDNSAKLSIALPSTMTNKVAAASTANLMLGHVAINVTGPGMTAPVVYSWDSCRDCPNPTTTPDSFLVSVPSGTGRLIQVLAVYEDPNTSQMTFYYGDRLSDLNSADVAVDVDIQQVGQGAITGGRVSGRYFTTTTSGPTGPIDIKYNPGNGKPALIVDQSIIANGWFSIFMLSGANLQYVLRNTGEMLWGQEMSFESAAMNPAENSGAYFSQRVRAYLPVHIRVQDNGGTLSYYPQESENYVWGYWGPGATGKKVCTYGLDSSPVPQKLKRYVSTDYANAPALSVAHYVNYNLAVPTKTELTNTTTPYSTIVVQGGDSMSSTCGSHADTAANQYSNFLKVTLDLFDGNGGDSVAGFYGIFRRTSTYSFVNVSGDDPRVLTGQLLPGVESIIGSLRLFKKVTSDEMHLNSPNCLDLANLGFIAGSSTDATVDSAGQFSLTSNISATEANSGVSAVFCPIRTDGSLSPLGVFLGKWNFYSYSGGNGGGGGSGQTATQIVINTPQLTANTGTIGNNICTPLAVEGRNSGYSASFPTGTSLTFATNDANTQVYQDSSCSGTPISSAQINYYSHHYLLYVKRAVSGSLTANLSVTASNSLGTASASISYLDVPGTITPKIKIQAPSTIRAYECYSMRLESWHVDTASSMIANFYNSLGSEFNLTLPNGSGLNFYYNNDCQYTSMSSVSLGSSVTASVAFMYTGSATSLSLQPTSITPSSPISTSSFVGGSNITVQQPGTASNIDLMIPTNVQEGQCQYVKARVTDSNGATTPATTAMTINLSTTTSGSFYSDSSCGAATSTVDIAAATTSQAVYFKSTAQGTGSVTASSSSPTLSVTKSLQITPPSFSQILIAMPGQSFSPGTGLVGTPSSLPQGTPSTINVYLVNYNNQLDTNANGNLLVGGYASNATFSQSPSAIAFTNGQATVNITPDSSYNNVYVNLNSNYIYGNSASATTYAAATMLNIYMSNASALAPGGCQIFAVIPESSDGAAQTMGAVNYTLSADNGGAIYTDASCTTLAISSYTFSPGERVTAFYFKQTANATNSAITVTPANGLISTPLNVATNSTATGTATQFLFTGRMTSMKQSVCQPYLVSVADSGGRSVVIGADQAVTLQVNSGGGTVGTFDDQSCDLPYSGAPTNISAATNYSTVFLTAMISGSNHILQASGGGLTTATSPTIVPFY